SPAPPPPTPATTPATVTNRTPMDLATIVGIVVAVGAILGGQVLEGGHISSIMQPTAAIIVLGGTAGAVAVQFPGAGLKRALSDLKHIFKPAPSHLEEIVKTIVGLANKARREGLVAIEKEGAGLSNEVLGRAPSPTGRTRGSSSASCRCTRASGRRGRAPSRRRRRRARPDPRRLTHAERSPRHAKEEAPRAREPRALAGLLRGLHHPAVRV